MTQTDLTTSAAPPVAPLRDVLVLTSELPSSAQRALKKVGAAAGLDVLTRSGVGEQFADALDQISPRAVVLDVASSSASAVCVAVRNNPLRAHVPIIGLVANATDLSFADLFAWGGDELIGFDSVMDLVPQLRALEGARHAMAPRDRGRALIADADIARRAPLARVLQGAGFRTVFASSQEEIVRVCTEPLALATVELSLAQAGATGEILRTSSNAVLIVSAAPRDFTLARTSVASSPRIGLFDAFAPPDNLLFLANDLASKTATDRRTAPRLLHGTSVGIRLAGGERDLLGYTFNVSNGGIFVRTLHPFELGQDVWLEVCPPRSSRRVRLSATTVWRRPFGPIHAALSPAGIGLRINGGMAGDIERFQAGCEAVAADLGIVPE